MDFRKTKNGNFVQTIIFITLDRIISGSKGEYEEISMPTLLPLVDNLVCFGSFEPFLGAHFLACRVREEVEP